MKKVVEAVAQGLGCKSVDINKETPDISEVDMLLIGSGNYGSKTDNKLLMFLNSMQPGSDKKVVDELPLSIGRVAVFGFHFFS